MHCHLLLSMVVVGLLRFFDRVCKYSFYELIILYYFFWVVIFIVFFFILGLLLFLFCLCGFAVLYLVSVPIS